MTRALLIEVALWLALAGLGLGFHLWLVAIGLRRLAAVRRLGLNGRRLLRARGFVRANIIRAAVNLLLLLVGLTPFLPRRVFPALMFGMLALLDVQSALEWRLQRSPDPPGALARLRRARSGPPR